MSEFFELKRLKRDLSDFLFGVPYPHRRGLEDDEYWSLMAVDAMVRAHFSFLREEPTPGIFYVRFSLAGQLINFEASANSYALAVARAIDQTRETFQTHETQIGLSDLL
ncbi:MAG TPA: hypothetical protein VGH90_08865 [Chthoniobacteraceae bacterium]|jgi:hypothetical protein